MPRMHGKSKKEYKRLDGIGSKTVADIGNENHLKFAEKELTFCEKNNIRIRVRHLEEFPVLLNECIDAPSILYQKGNIDDSIQKISIVGTRNMTSYGKQFIGDFFEAAQSSRYVSVSGLALGIDKEVHEQSIRYQNLQLQSLLMVSNTYILLKTENCQKKFFRKVVFY